MTIRFFPLVALAVAAALVISPTALAAPPTWEVEVINDAVDPLPVSIESTPQPIPVSIESTPAAPPDQPILLFLGFFDATFNSAVASIQEINRVCVGVTPACQGAGGTYTVPADTMLVIESVGVFARTAQVPTKMSATMSFDIPGAGGSFGFDLGESERLSDTSSGRRWADTYPVTLRAPSGATVRGGVVWDQSFSGLTEASVVISGRLVTTP